VSRERLRRARRPGGLSPREGAVLDALAEMHREFQEFEDFTGEAVEHVFGHPCAGSLGSLVEYGLVRRLQRHRGDDGAPAAGAKLAASGAEAFSYRLTPDGVIAADGRRRERERARMAVAGGGVVRPLGRRSAESRELPRRGGGAGGDEAA
jgi:hypothetical protein